MWYILGQPSLGPYSDSSLAEPHSVVGMKFALILEILRKQNQIEREVGGRKSFLTVFSPGLG